ncbi:acetyl-CoA carboxylase biotin carboxylase subunit [Candidatus Xianfuyuplasma coldseepsis]|uniref:Biotin carboxylase n=1 Tax=Candidatus Xianfuyuplasma coldseepsis TaxID=2782163 RepID=A0A7L7KRS8_9MOLU|nr:acetyl-CoA carboxylase biotin carboxylase subunit [Xianfuyuplasma coldseepsis]QMS85433.1 acetyl-CoA carboxylase biotin carboxylase subunit [Xianfuyuplasma coldseepsis]
MFQKILIANRGEIAVRIIRACKQMGIETVAIYSQADRYSLHVQLADESVCVGGNKSSESYLNMENIVTAAISTGAEAIHPGFGFLSENAKFAELCIECGIRFIGPKASAIHNMGNKSKARQMMMDAGVPVVPGSDGAVASLAEARQLADEIGYPVLIKASAGGGGRGMRVAYTKEEFDNSFETAKSEAKIAFGDDTMYMEKFILNPRHIEFQIIADKYGNVCHLGERDCSIQRRNQKVIEEAPSLISDELRNKMAEAAINAAREVGYENAGTIEFLVSGDEFYFIEMNTRIQVEHPVTEMVTGVDIIQEQIRIASGEALSFTQEDVELKGHAIEVRLNAENPRENFRPSPGTISLVHVPSGHGVRFDSFIYSGYQIPPYYDSMMGKLIVHGKTRLDAIMKMRASLDEVIIDGVDNNRAFCMQILQEDCFVKGETDTGFIAAHLEQLLGYDDHE